MRFLSPATMAAFLVGLSALACADVSNLSTPDAGGYRYDDLPDAEHQDAALAEFRVISRWEKFELTYFFENGTQRLEGDTERRLVRDAFALWSAQTPLTFTETSNPAQADISVLFAPGEHGDGDPFDGPGNVLAHASAPNPYDDRQVILHFDDDERWVDSQTRNVDLLTVAAHEIGHTLGLEHSRDPEALMYAAYTGPHRALGEDDIAGIKSLYGISRQPAPAPEAPAGGEEAPSSANEDTDRDGVADADETLRTGTDPTRADTDGDGIGDGVEIVNRMNPLDADMDRDGMSDGDEVRAGTDPFFPDQQAGISSELENEISEFLTIAIERQIEAYEQGDASLASDVLAGGMYSQLEADILALNQNGLVQFSSIDYYESFIADIRVLNEQHVEVDTCEVWSSATYEISSGAFIGSDGPNLLPQTVTIQELDSGWYITQVEFFDPPAFCR